LLCSDVSENSFDLDSTIPQTFGQISDANGQVTVTGTIQCMILILTAFDIEKLTQIMSINGNESLVLRHSTNDGKC